MPSAVGRPEAKEFNEHYAAYVARVTEPDPVDAMTRQIEDTVNLLSGVSEAKALGRYAPGKWSVKEVIGHLADTERIFSYRALRIARGDTTALPGFDQDAYIPTAAFDRHPLQDLVGELRDVRRSTLALFRSFDRPAWGRAGTASGWPLSVRAIAYIIPGHERHHVAILRERYGLR